MIGYIYQFFYKDNGKRYIGQSTSLKTRKLRHSSSAKRGEKGKFYNAIRKYGIENFEFSVIEVIKADTEQELQIILDEKEKYWINYHNSFKKGYNATIGGKGTGFGKANPMFGKSHSDKAKQKISIANKGKRVGKDNPNWGGKAHTEETKLKISNANKGNPAHNKGKPMSEAQKEKISKTKQKNQRQKGSKNGNAKLNEIKVTEIKYLLIKKEYSIKAIAEMFNISSTAIGEIKRGKKWKHVLPDLKVSN